jgi:hypothetical protein
MKKRAAAFGYQPRPKAHAREIAAAYGARERLNSIARDKAERTEDDQPLPDAVRRVSLAERAAIWRQTLAPGVDLDCQIARDKEAALAKPNSAGFIEDLMADLGLSESGARLYALALRSIETPEIRSQTVAMADPATGRTSDRFNISVTTTGPGGPPIGTAHYYPSQIPAQLVLGLPPSAQLTGTQRAEAARLLEAAHAEWEAVGILEWRQRGSWGLLRL